MDEACRTTQSQSCDGLSAWTGRLSLWLNSAGIHAILPAGGRTGGCMPPVDSDAVLRAEANAIHGGGLHAGGEIGPEVGGAALYRALHQFNATALCLSGG